MTEMARSSCAGYRAVVRDDARFVSLFQSITPGEGARGQST
jgi:phosphoenolpyruvate carboxylase